MAQVTGVSANRRTIRDQVAGHPMFAFVALSYVLSSAWLLNYRVDLGTVNGFGVIASTAPALAAMIVSACSRPEPSGAPAGKRWRLFGTMGILALGVMAALRLWVAAGLVTVSGMDASATPYPSLMAFVMDVVAAGVVGFVLSGVHSPRLPGQARPTRPPAPQRRRPIPARARRQGRRRRNLCPNRPQAATPLRAVSD